MKAKQRLVEVDLRAEVHGFAESDEGVLEVEALAAVPAPPEA